jgi:hypothetical protein
MIEDLDPQNGGEGLKIFTLATKWGYLGYLARFT